MSPKEVKQDRRPWGAPETGLWVPKDVLVTRMGFTFGLFKRLIFAIELVFGWATIEVHSTIHTEHETGRTETGHIEMYLTPWWDRFRTRLWRKLSQESSDRG